MYQCIVTTNIDRVNHVLRPIYVGQGSALTVSLPAITDADADSVAFFLTTLAGPVIKHLGALNASGVWDIYVPAWAFPTAGQTDYQIVVTNAEGHPYWLGRGSLVIFAADHEALPPEPPPDGYIMYAPGGAAYRLTITTNELGESALTLIPVEA